MQVWEAGILYDFRRNYRKLQIAVLLRRRKLQSALFDRVSLKSFRQSCLLLHAKASRACEALPSSRPPGKSSQIFATLQTISSAPSVSSAVRVHGLEALGASLTQPWSWSPTSCITCIAQSDQARLSLCLASTTSSHAPALLSRCLCWPEPAAPMPSQMIRGLDLLQPFDKPTLPYLAHPPLPAGPPIWPI